MAPESLRSRRLALTWVLLLVGSTAQAADVEWLGEAVLGRQPVGVSGPVGGLSGLSYDPTRDRYYAISDDRGEFGPVRLYELAIRFENGRLVEGGAEATGAVELRGPGRAALPPGAVDFESLAARPGGGWIVASEGAASSGVPAALIEFGPDGTWLGQLALPRRLRPRRKKGIRNNAALESVTLSPDGRWLFSATESALLQDGDAATFRAGSSNRLFRYHFPSRRLRATYLYRTEPIAVAPAGDAFAVNGLVDLLALDGDRLLALERSYTAGAGNQIRLFLVDLGGATDVSGRRRLKRTAGVAAIQKQLLLEVGSVGARPDNVEGMTFGPDLFDGRRTLVMIADDNFNPRLQRNQVLAFALTREAIAERRRNGARESK